MKAFTYGQDQLTPALVLKLARRELAGSIPAAVREKIVAGREQVEAILADDLPVYGVNTGFGPLCTTRISRADTERLQENILRSHSTGVGPDLSDEIVRLMLVTKIHALAQGYSGVRPEIVERILWLLDNDITPVVPAQGSVGASGDLAPLAHLFLPLIGQGYTRCRGAILPADEALAKMGVTPLQLTAKEGLALINGTQYMLAFAIHGLERLSVCCDNADIIGAMSLEALQGSVSPFRDELHHLRPHDGSRFVANTLKNLLDGSAMVASHADCDRVQDPYSLRCMPQVHGATRTAWRHLHEIVITELNSVTDNPVILPDGTAVSGGNFHGQPLALPLDYTTVAASELGNISDRRTYLLLDGEKRGLPRLLMKETGINSGFMIAQYTSAALASENKTLCFPASADSIPTSLGQEDHVSMGSISGRKLAQLIDNLENILAIELVTAAQAFDFRHPLKSSPLLEAGHRQVRRVIDHADQDRVFAEDIDQACQLIRNQVLLRAVTGQARELGCELYGSDRVKYSLGN